MSDQISADQQRLILESLHIVQMARELTPQQAPAGSSKKWYEIIYEVLVENNDVTHGDPVGDVVRKVVYLFDERWYPNPRRERVNAKQNFRLSVRVWGSTRVNVEVELVGFAKPVCAEVFIRLGGDEHRFPDEGDSWARGPCS